MIVTIDLARSGTDDKLAGKEDDGGAADRELRDCEPSLSGEQFWSHKSDMEILIYERKIRQQ
jgi:hypothetical protein